MKIRFKKGEKEIFREIFGRPKIQFFFRFEQIYLNSKREEKRREEKRRDGADRPTEERERERESGAQVRAFEVKAEGLLNIPKLESFSQLSQLERASTSRKDCCWTVSQLSLTLFLSFGSAKSRRSLLVN